MNQGVSKDKVKMLESALKNIQKDCGETAVDMYTNFGQSMHIPRESTGLIAIDLALGGGLPRGDFVEIFGKPQAGKTTLCYWFMGQMQKRGGVVGFIDVEQDFDPVWAQKNGVNLDTLLISQPDSLEQALTIAEGLIRSNAVDMIVVDSLAALTPQAVLDRGIDQDTVGLRARKMAQFFDKTRAFVKTSGTIFLFTNQWRESPNMFQKADSPGGWGGKHSFGIRIEVSRKGSDLIKEGEEVVAQKGTVLMVKNKVAPPYKRADFRIDFDTGISKEFDLYDFAVQFGVIEKAGAWFKYEDRTIAQGEKNLVKLLGEDEGLFNEINQKVRAILNFDKRVVAEEQTEVSPDEDTDTRTS